MKREAPGSGMELCLEVIIASLTDRSEVRYCVIRRSISHRTEDPDDLVHEILAEKGPGRPAVPLDTCIIHSTSWRYESRNRIVLTYLVYSDSALFSKDGCPLLSLAHHAASPGGSPTRPRPDTITVEQVVVHGIRHLSHLVRQDSPGFLSRLSPASIDALRAMESRPAGRIG
jgi:hypothetical protein